MLCVFLTCTQRVQCGQGGVDKPPDESRNELVPAGVSGDVPSSLDALVARQTLSLVQVSIAQVQGQPPSQFEPPSFSPLHFRRGETELLTFPTGLNLI